MDNMEDNKKFNWLALIFALISVGLATYIICDKVLTNNSKTNEVEKNDK